MTVRALSLVSALVLSALVLAAPGAAKKRPKPPPPPPPPPSTSSLYVKSYANVLDGVRCPVTPQEVRATSDGGSITLSLSSCNGLSWLVKTDALGVPQWQKEVGCFDIPPGSYAYANALDVTADGGYVVAGGMRDCKDSPVCLYLTSRQCGLITRLDATGNVVWSRVYLAASERDTGFWDVKQTRDGGFVAAGTYIDTNSDIGGHVLKVDSQGVVQWHTLIGPEDRTHALLEAVHQTADGGYVAAGKLYPLTDGLPPFSAFVVRLDSSGNVAWQRGFNSVDSNGVQSAWAFAERIIQTSDGGYALAGGWGNGRFPGECCQGHLLIKLDAAGNSQWQKAYSGGVHCFFNGFNTTCGTIGGVAYALHQTADGGYSLAGSGQLKFTDSIPMVPWMARTDAGGNLVWQHTYYETSSAGRPITQYFASSTPTKDGGFLASGFTENPVDFKGELFAVRTDSAGLVDACNQIHAASPLDALDPALTAFATTFAVQTSAPRQGAVPALVRPTAIATRGGQC